MVSILMFLSSPQSLFLHQFVHPMARILEFTLADQFIPDGLGELIGRRDGHDVRLFARTRGLIIEIGFLFQRVSFRRFRNALNACLRVSLSMDGGVGSFMTISSAGPERLLIFI